MNATLLSSTYQEAKNFLNERIQNGEKTKMFDLTKQAETERHQRAFDEGVREGKNGGLWDDLVRDLGETVTVLVPKSTEHQSREAGYWEGQRKRTKS